MSIEEQARDGGGGGAEIMAVAEAMVVGQRIVPVSGDLVAVPGQVLGDGDANDAAPRRFRRMGDARPAGKHQHQASDKGQQRAHRRRLYQQSPAL